jgi:hypothetical protein
MHCGCDTARAERTTVAAEEYIPLGNGRVSRLRSGGGDRPFLLEAFAAENGTALRGSEGDGGLLAALRAGSARFDARVVPPAFWRRRGGEHGYALGLASLAAFGLVLETLVVEKQLFPGGKNEFRAAIDAGEYLVLKIH